MQTTNHRLIDLAERPAWLRVSLDRLVIEMDGDEAVTVPLVELAALVVSHPQVKYTQAVLPAIAAAGGVFVACDAKHKPAAMMIPLAGHHLQAERFAQQANTPLPVRKRMWQQIVRAKIRAQAAVLKQLRGDDRGLLALIPRVQSGDAGNVEAQAARRYWPALFADQTFRRDPDGGDANAQLNYGYAVVRAIVARAICAAGLHPSLGLYHHNRYDTFCLADDLMEPLRPVVDAAVVRRVQATGMPSPLDKAAKAEILSALTGRFSVEGESRTLFDIVGRMATSLADVFGGTRREMVLPTLDAGLESNGNGEKNV